MSISRKEFDALKPGDWIHDAIGDLRVMANTEGYAMVRRRQSMPFILCRSSKGLTRSEVGLGKSPEADEAS